MTIPTNTFTSYAAIGNREDLSDIIYTISPTDTPFMSNASKDKAAAVLHEWQTDSLASAADNKQIEGDDATADSRAATVRRGNYCQIARKVVSVTGTQDTVNKAGRKSEMAYQLAKAGKELKRDMENAFVGLNRGRSAGNSSTARQTASVLSWITTNNSMGTSGANPTGDGTDARTDGTQRALTESILKDVLQQVWTSGGTPDTLMVGAFNKRIISGFTGNATRMDDAKDMKLYAAIDVYVSDFGSLKVVPNRFMRSRDGLVLDMEYWKIAYLRAFNQFDLAKTGDSERKELVVEYCLEASNEAASGIMADLTTV